jgi:excisionase family DNA binding protein
MKETLPPPAQANYTLAEAATYLRRSTRTVRRLVDRGLLRRDRHSRRIIIPGTDVENLTTRFSKQALGY